MAVYKKSAEMRRSILDAVEHLVRENGYSNTSMKEVSEYLNIPRSLIYYYFQNKADIMHALYDERFEQVEQMALKLLPQGEEPLVRLMLKYLLFRRTVICDPLFTEYIATAPEYARRVKDSSQEEIVHYYADSRELFEYYGKPTDGEEFRIHVFMIESIARGLIVGSYYGMLELSDYDYIRHFGERAIVPSFDLTKGEFKKILDRAFELADRAGIE